MPINIVKGFGVKRHYKLKHLDSGGFGLQTDPYLIIGLPDSWALKLIARSMVLALLIVSFPWLRSDLAVGVLSLDVAFSPSTGVISDPVNLDLLPLLFRDLKNEGLLKTGDRTLFVSNGEEDAVSISQILSENEMVLVSATDEERQSSVPNDSFDFTFTNSFQVAKGFIDRSIRVDGIVAVQLSGNPSVTFNEPWNFHIVYLRRFDSTTVLAMRKTSYAAGENSFAKRRLFEFSTEAKKAALKKLEDVLLEPPRAASGKSRTYLKRTRYLPDLMGDSLESYPRRVFIDVGLPEKEGGSGTSWFENNYPTRNLDFDTYKIETVTAESSGKEVPQTGMSDWLTKNVQDDEYVVMKAEAEVVEEMMESKAINLVDELFLECKPKGLGGRKNRSRRIRAYWECLALYGKLRDEGVAVHQWWG